MWLEERNQTRALRIPAASNQTTIGAPVREIPRRNGVCDSHSLPFTDSTPWLGFWFPLRHSSHKRDPDGEVDWIFKVSSHGTELAIAWRIIQRRTQGFPPALDAKLGRWNRKWHGEPAAGTKST